MRRQPKRSKYGKQFKGGCGRKKGRGVEVESRKRGEYGLMARENVRLSARQREAGRRTRRNCRNRRGKVWRNVYPAVPVTKKPREVRMGKGKGAVEYWAVHVRPGKRRYEVRGVDEKRARRALGKVGKKRPVRTKRVRCIVQLVRITISKVVDVSSSLAIPAVEGCRVPKWRAKKKGVQRVAESKERYGVACVSSSREPNLGGFACLPELG